MALYTRYTEVVKRLQGKVEIVEQSDDDNAMTVDLVNRLINESEGIVEFDLSPRYAAPFQTHSGQSFINLPERPTKEIIRSLCEIKSVVHILVYDFGMGGATDSEEYIKQLKAEYKEIHDKLIKSRQNLHDCHIFN